MRWTTKLSCDVKLCQEFRCQKLLKSVNYSSTYSQQYEWVFLSETRCIMMPGLIHHYHVELTKTNVYEDPSKAFELAVITTPGRSVVTFSVTSVCVSVWPLRALIFECLDLETSFLLCRHNFKISIVHVRISRSYVKVKVIRASLNTHTRE